MVRSPHLNRAAPPSTDPLAALLGDREGNLRQVILRAHRAMNAAIAQRFAARGFDDVRPRHLAVLSNMNLDETSTSELVERAQATVDGIRQIVGELEGMSYVETQEGAGDVLRLRFTDHGWELMLTSFNIQHEIEHDLGARLGPDDLGQLRRILGVLARIDLEPDSNG